MQRPCFALAVLLGTMASSVLVVGRVHSQLPAVASTTLPSPSSTYGNVSCVQSVSIVRGQSVDAGYESWWEYTGGADHVASDDEQMRDANPSLATEVELKRAAALWALPTTGYDSAYDFAMHDGWYSDVRPFPSDTESSWSAEKYSSDETEDGARTDDLSGPTGCEEDDYDFGDRFNVDFGRSWVCPWSRPDVTTNRDDVVECEDENVAPVTTHRPLDCSRWIIRQLTEAIQWTKSSAQDWSSQALTSPAIKQLDHWMAVAATEWTKTTVRGWVAYANQQPWVVQMQYRWTSIAFRPQEVDVSGYYGEQTEPQDLHEEVVLLTAAETLDRIGMTVLEASQTLRIWAANRTAAKGSSKRVANRPQ